MIVNRNDDVPLRTKDGGATWAPFCESCKLVAKVHRPPPPGNIHHPAYVTYLTRWGWCVCSMTKGYHHGMSYSWTAKTLIMMGAGGTQTADHPHAPFVWVSKDGA